MSDANVAVKNLNSNHIGSASVSSKQLMVSSVGAASSLINVSLQDMKSYHSNRHIFEHQEVLCNEEKNQRLENLLRLGRLGLSYHLIHQGWESCNLGSWAWLKGKMFSSGQHILWLLGTESTTLLTSTESAALPTVWIITVGKSHHSQSGLISLYDHPKSGNTATTICFILIIIAFCRSFSS